METVENPLEELTNLNAVRYLTISGVSVLAYDTLITLPDEVYYVWIPLTHEILWLFRHGLYGGRRPLSWTMPKILLLLTRYTMLVISGIYLVGLVPFAALSSTWCRSVVPTVFYLDVLIETVGSGVVFHRLHKLWNFGPRGTYILLCSFVFTKVISLTFAFEMIRISSGEIIYVGIGDIRICSILKAPRIGLGAWVPAVIFDLFAFTLLLLNALSRPRAESQRLLDILYKDGVFFFLTTVCMRLLNVVFNSFAPPSLFYIGIIFSATIVTTVSSRLFLSLFTGIDEDDLDDGSSNISMDYIGVESRP